MSDVIRINSTMRILIDEYKRSVLTYCQYHWDDDILYPTMWEEVSSMTDQQLITKALNDQFCYYKYDEKVPGL